MINCSLSNTCGKGISSSRVQNMFCGKVCSERERLAPDKGTERSSLQSFHLHYNREACGQRAHARPPPAHCTEAYDHQETDVLNKSKHRVLAATPRHLDWGFRMQPQPPQINVIWTISKKKRIARTQLQVRMKFINHKVLQSQ